MIARPQQGSHRPPGGSELARNLAAGVSIGAGDQDQRAFPSGSAEGGKIRGCPDAGSTPAVLPMVMNGPPVAIA
jgi:hypothetical protein